MADIFYSTLCSKKADTFAIGGRPEETPIFICRRGDKVVDVLKVTQLLSNATERKPVCYSVPCDPLTSFPSSSLCCAQGMIQHNFLSVPVMLENDKWYGFLDMMVGHIRTAHGALARVSVR